MIICSFLFCVWKVLELSNGDKLVYDKICLCTGASPNVSLHTHMYVVHIYTCAHLHNCIHMHLHIVP